MSRPQKIEGASAAKSMRPLKLSRKVFKLPGLSFSPSPSLL
jgi:hypothetical protein